MLENFTRDDRDKMKIDKLKEFYKGKKVLVTGHTGFKGSWLALWLINMGAKVIGFSIDSPYKKGIYELARLKDVLIDYGGDITNLKKLKAVFETERPEMVFHLAAQAIVRESYNNPQSTFNSNLIGTVNVLECIRQTDSVKAAVMVTTDKCYKNKEWVWGYRENDELGGSDPYSASKACAELAIKSYHDSFFKNSKVSIASVRAGNVIGGGDWAKDRIVTDSIEALENNTPIWVRNPSATRPWQFVLEPLLGYLMVGEKLYKNNLAGINIAPDGISFGNFNFGPDEDHILTVKEFVELLISEWNSGSWKDIHNPNEPKKESVLLSLDCSKAKRELGWSPKLGPEETVRMTADWYKLYKYKDTDVYKLSKEQIEEYESLT